MKLKAHRINDGKLIRRGAFVSLTCGVLFACRSWAAWFPLSFLDALNFSVVESWDMDVASVTTTGMFLLGLFLTYWLVFANAKTSNFLIEVESELRKVTWPEFRPLFKAKTEIWGHCYVVVFLLCLLAGIIFVLDYGLVRITKFLFEK